MKKILSFLFTTALITGLFVSCQKDDVSFDEKLLIGKWRSGTLYYRYDRNYMGATWDTRDDVTEEEGQEFEWELVKSDLTHIHLMEGGEGVVPKYYKVTELTATTLKYKDEFEKRFSFVKADDD